MKAWTHTEYGPPELLRLEDVSDPTAGAGEVVVRFRASTVNAYDWRHLRADPGLVRLVHGLRRPHAGAVLGTDVAGIVDTVGADVTDVRPGDEVVGSVSLGAWAERVVVPRDQLAVLPEGIDHGDAAALAMAGTTALAAVRDVGEVRAGQRVLVLGASGGVGTFVVQLAVAAGADVTGVCSTRNLDLVRSLGASRVVDHTREDVAALGPFDVVVDIAGSLSLHDLRKMTTRDGTIALVGGIAGGGGRLLGPATQIFAGALLGRLVSQRIMAVRAAAAADDLADLVALLDDGTLRVPVERTFAFADVPAALAHGETRRTSGKVVVTR